MSLSYAGVDLESPTNEQISWVENNLSLADVYEFEDIVWPTKNLTYLTYPGFIPRKPITPQRLFWPRGASRWAVGHFLATEDQTDSIRNAVFPTSTAQNIQAAVLKMTDGTRQVVTNLFLLPPRPLGGLIGGLGGHYLLTLVDHRYYWWYETAVLQVNETTTTWDNLYRQIEAILGIVINNDAINSAYLFPSGRLGSNYEYMPLLLDAVAYNVGQRIVRNLDGSVHALSVQSSLTDVTLNMQGQYPVQAGGLFNMGV